MSKIDKKKLSEGDICTKFITPAIVKAGDRERVLLGLDDRQTDVLVVQDVVGPLLLVP